ncbi:MAG: hypothetical protein DMG86_21375 [Acidobacteria bacterium]|nr:MAG: hypothetical protein DMG86_21375 [Acidobacteriota bacterium]PYX04154.1 MAG: hypothetical protein DMG85_18370 [Acidobacteriota bacterium]
MNRCFAVILCSAAIWPAPAQQNTGASSAPSSAETLPLTNRKNLTPLEQTLIANTKAVPAAWKKKDAEFFKATLTDDFLEVAIDGKVYGKNDVLEGVHMADVQEYSPYDVHVLPINDSAAIVTYDCIVRMRLGEDPVPRYQHITDIWVKQGEQWRLKFQQATAAQ